MLIKLTILWTSSIVDNTNSFYRFTDENQLNYNIIIICALVNTFKGCSSQIMVWHCNNFINCSCYNIITQGGLHYNITVWFTDCRSLDTFITYLCMECNYSNNVRVCSVYCVKNSPLSSPSSPKVLPTILKLFTIVVLLCQTSMFIILHCY